MKKILYFCLFLAVFLTAEISAQVSWKQVGQNLAIPQGIAKAGNFNGTIFAVGPTPTGGRISRSTDGGATFTASDYSQSVTSVDKYNNFNNVIFVGVQNSGKPPIWRSYDDGITKQKKDGYNQNGVAFFDVVMLDTNIAVVAGSNGIYKTIDFSQTYWIKKYSLPSGKLMTKILRLSNGNLVAGSEGSSNGWGIYLSTDAGESWTNVDGNSSGNFIFMGFVQVSNGTIYSHIYDIGSSQSFFRKSTNNGASWSGLTTGNFAGGTKSGASGFAAYNNNLYVREGPRGISMSSNEGSTWQWNFKKINYVGSTSNGLLMFPGEASTDGTFYTSVDPSATANISSIPLNIPITLSGIGTITFTTCTASSLSAYKFSIISPLILLTDDGVNQHWEILMEPPTSSYNGSITFSYDPTGIGFQGALQSMRFVPPKSSNGYNGAWEYLTTSKDTVNHTFTVSGITEFPIWITLRKNGPLPGNITVKPVDLNFGQVLVNENLSKNDTITNTGSSPVNFTATTITGADSAQFSIVSGGAPFSLPAGQSKIITLNFAPTATGIKSAKLELTHDGMGATQVNLAGEGTQGILDVPNATVNFGNVEVGKNRDTVQTYSNIGNGPITISAINISGASYSVVSGNAPFTILPGATHDVTFRFASSLPTGAKNATASFVHNGQGGSNDVFLTGASTQAGIAINPLNLNFGLVDTLMTKVDSVRVTNSGSAPLAVSSYTLTGPNADQFTVVNNAPPFTLQPGEFKEVSVKFSPRAPNGLRTAQLNLTHNAPGSPSVVQLNGQAVPVELKYFSADIAEDKIILRWATASETNNFGFEVERAVAGSSSHAPARDLEFKKLAFIKGAGRTTKEQIYEFRLPKTIGFYQFRLKQIDFSGEYQYSQILEVDILPTKFIINQNYPNPFNPSTTISIEVPVSGLVEIDAYNIAGQRVDSFREKREAGLWNMLWTPKNLASGAYYVIGKFNNSTCQIKAMLLK